jgi:hypothetical protein
MPATITVTLEITSYLTLVIAINLLTPELNPSAQRCLTKFFTGDFAS